MERGVWIFSTSSLVALALAACTTDSGKLTIRSTPTALAQGSRPIPFRIAEANGQLALGNVALALESYRKAFRDDPQSIEALAGIATCYDRMGRFDLSRRHYEAALAIAPGEPRLYAAFAGSLDLQGRGEEAMAVRREMTQRVAAAVSPASGVPAAPAAPVSRIDVAVAAAVPQAAPASAVPIQRRSVGQLAPPILAAPRTLPTPPLPVPAEIAVAGSGPAVRPDTVPEALARSLAATPSIAAHSVTVALAAPRPPAPVRAAPADGPRLERMSLGEVALVTAMAPSWRARMVEKTDRSATIRFAAVRPATGSVVLLNAARHQGLAARTRVYLTALGWRRIAIGDAPAVSARSVILYSPERRVLAQRLSHQFGFSLRHQVSADKRLTILLGRDAARSVALKPRSG